MYALAALPPTGGFSTGIFERDAVSSGIELDARVRVIDRRGLRWELRGVGATQSNHVEGGTPIYGTYRAQLADGQPIWGMPSTVPTYADRNGDGILSDTEYSTTIAEKELLSSTPTFEGALHSSLSLGTHLVVGAVLDRRSGFAARAASAMTHCARPRCREGQDPAATIDEQATVLAQYRGLYTSTDASFTRLREVSLRWSLPAAFERGVASLRVATIVVAGRDLYSWTSWKGLDPEINSNSRGVLVRSDERGVPLPRRLMIGVELGGSGR
jgi:hypothetical protein